jgi:hypothetical protein
MSTVFHVIIIIGKWILVSTELGSAPDHIMIGPKLIILGWLGTI